MYVRTYGRTKKSLVPISVSWSQSQCQHEEEEESPPSVGVWKSRVGRMSRWNPACGTSLLWTRRAGRTTLGLCRFFPSLYAILSDATRITLCVCIEEWKGGEAVLNHRLGPRSRERVREDTQVKRFFFPGSLGCCSALSIDSALSDDVLGDWTFAMNFSGWGCMY